MPLLIPLISRVVVWAGASYVATKVVEGTTTTDNDIELQELANEGGISIGDVLLVAGAVVATVYVYKKVAKNG